MHKIIHFVDKQHFGNQIFVYCGNIRSDRIFFIIMKDREEIVYFFVDNSLQRIYPVNSYIELIGFEFDINRAPNVIDIQFDIDLSHYGSSACPFFLSNLIKQYV